MDQINGSLRTVADACRPIPAPRATITKGGSNLASLFGLVNTQLYRLGSKRQRILDTYFEGVDYFN